MSAFDNYGEDIGGQSYSSYSDTRGDSGGGGEGPRTPIDPTKGFDIAPPPAERLSLLDRVKSFGGDIFKGITSLALGVSPRNLLASQFLPTVIDSLKDRLFPAYKTGINTIELDDRFKTTTGGGITRLAEAPQLTFPFDFNNTGDPFKDNYYDRDGNYIGPTLAEAPQLTLPFDFNNTGDPFKDNYYDREGNYIGPTFTG